MSHKILSEKIYFSNYDFEKVHFISFEIDKCRRSIDVNDKRYFLSFPRLIFGLFYNHEELLCSYAGLRSANKVYNCPLPNFDGLGMCMALWMRHSFVMHRPKPKMILS